MPGRPTATTPRMPQRQPQATTPERKPVDASSPLWIDRRCGRHPGGLPPWNRCSIVFLILSVSTRRGAPCTDFVIPRYACSDAGTGAELRADKAGIGDVVAPDAGGGGCRDEALHWSLLELGACCPLISAFATSPRSAGRCAPRCRRHRAAPWRGRRHP